MGFSGPSRRSQGLGHGRCSFIFPYKDECVEFLIEVNNKGYARIDFEIDQELVGLTVVSLRG